MQIPSLTRRKFLAQTSAIIGSIGLIDATASLVNTIRPKGIVVHHSALPQNESLQQIEKLHRNRGFGVFYWCKFYVIGYHYIISADGILHSIRPNHLRGAHARGANNMIGICLLGNFDSSSGASVPTVPQMNSLVALCRSLMQKYDLNTSNIHKHSDIDSYTVCPGDNFPFKELLSSL